MVATVRTVVCLALWLAVCEVRGFQIPPRMNKTIQNLLRHYGVQNEDIFDGNQVFSTKPLNGKLEAKKVFMGGILETYEKLLGHMLKELPTPRPQTAGSNERPAAAAPTAGTASGAETGAGGTVQAELTYILEQVKKLRQHRYREQETLLHGLQALRHIKMHDHIVQSKALWELPLLFEEASTLVDNNTMQRRRRRRQARRAKGHLRG